MQGETYEKEKEKNKDICSSVAGTDRYRSNRDPRFHYYTPLTVPRGKVLDEALQAELILAPRQAQTPQYADTTKHCQYHCNYDHTTKAVKH